MPAGATYEPIATSTVSGSAASSIVFSSISSSYTDLRLIIVGKSSADYSVIGFRFNSDTGSNYSQTSIYGTGSAAASQRGSSTSYGQIDAWNGMMSSQVTMGILDVFNYAGSTNKTTLGQGSMDLNGSGAVSRTVSLWRSTAAITSITLISGGGGANFAIGTTATLYGIKAA